MNDLISRQAAMEAVLKHAEVGRDVEAYQLAHTHIIEVLHEAPSAQPELVRCKDCEHYTKIRIPGLGRCSMHDRASQYHDYCSWAKRRKDEMGGGK